MPSPTRGSGGVPQFPPSVPQVRSAYKKIGFKPESGVFFKEGACCALSAVYLASAGGSMAFVLDPINRFVDFFKVPRPVVWGFVMGFDGHESDRCPDKDVWDAYLAGKRARKYLNPETPDES